jgi:DNA-binding beta-propeller fold protein YncE
MKNIIKTLSTLAAMVLLAPIFTTAAVGDSGVIVKPNGAKKFAVMPEGATHPEGITINPSNGDVIVGTFGAFGASINLVRFSSEGDLLASITIPDAILLGIGYNPDDGKIYLCNARDLAGNPDSRIQRIDADFTDASTVVDIATVPAIGAPANLIVGNPDGSTDEIEFGNLGRAPNDLTFDANGDLYFSDSFQGAVFRIADPATNCPAGGCGVPETVAWHGLLATVGFPPFGANGVAIRGDTLFVANTGDDTVLTIDLTADEPIEPVVLAQSINGADGIIYDSFNDLLWVAANQADQVVAIDPETGRVMAEIGEFLGINRDGSARGLIFPASLAEAANGKILVSNLAAALTGSEGEPEGDITKYTVSRINIPEFD